MLGQYWQTHGKDRSRQGKGLLKNKPGLQTNSGKPALVSKRQSRAITARTQPELVRCDSCVSGHLPQGLAPGCFTVPPTVRTVHMLTPVRRGFVESTQVWQCLAQGA